MVAVSRIEEVTDTKSEDTDAKWFDGDGVMRSPGGFNLMNNMGCTVLHGSTTGPLLQRTLRSLVPANLGLMPSTQLWSTTRCVPSSRAAQTSHEKIVSTAQSGTYKIYLVSSKNKVVTKQVWEQTLQKAASSIISTCDAKASQPQTNKPAQVSGKQVTMLLSEA
ncbi:hypothetical protein PSHT_10522 [Puccinia striiformis]|uniref:Uncharacterized protein n=1 Tax=Puccinia striiformis TaxID=27350 RepID=A0A2S4V988_9BASI|nr:hypothetical protein PSHT_10522 [Puccinia striiformis]